MLWTFLLVIQSITCSEAYRNKTRCWPDAFTEQDILCPKAGTIIKIESLVLGEPCTINNEAACTHGLSKEDPEEAEYYKHYSDRCDGRQKCQYALKEYRQSMKCDQGSKYTFKPNSLTMYYRRVTGKTQCESTTDQVIQCNPKEFIHIADIIGISRDNGLLCPSNEDIQGNITIQDKMHYCEPSSWLDDIKTQCNMVNKCNLSPLHVKGAKRCNKFINTLWVQYTCSEVYSSKVVMLPLAREMEVTDHDLHLLSDGFPYHNMPQENDINYSCYFHLPVSVGAFRPLKINCAF